MSDKGPKRRGFLSRLFGKPPVQANLDRRVDRIVQGFLENEGLTADLDDEAADELINWAIACARIVAQDALDLDDEAAEEAMYPRLRATRRMIRHANRLTVQGAQMNEVTRPTLLAKMIEQAAIVYGSDAVQVSALAQQDIDLSTDQRQAIHQLRALVKGLSEQSTLGEGET